MGPAMMRAAGALLLVLCSLPSAYGQTWCGKVYMANETVVPPGNQFKYPASSPTPLLALRCAPALIPYLPEDAAASPAILVDALVRYAAIANAKPIATAAALAPGTAGPADALAVSLTIDGKPAARGRVPLNGTVALPVNLVALGLAPRAEPYAVACVATTAGGETFTARTELVYLPAPRADQAGAVTKRDLRTGALLARPVGARAAGAAYEPVFPIGFYTNFGGYLDSNLTLLDGIRDLGFNLVHPVPPYDNMTAFDLVAERMEELGLYLMYDMRWTYTNRTSVAAQVAHVQPRSNLLLYYTADEPDGTSDPYNASTDSYALIRARDPYRPTSLVLNCQDFGFAGYAAGADVLLQDVYEIGNNVTWSSEWDTPCTRVRGDCGCDNCAGRFEDIRERVMEFRARFEVEGWERTKRVWTVPQAFGNGQYWKRIPTGAEWLVEAIVGVNAGARGIVSWNDPTTDDIRAAASLLARVLPRMTPFMFPPPSFASSGVDPDFQHVVTEDRVDLGVWAVGARRLVLAANLEYAGRSAGVRDVLGSGVDAGKVETLFEAGAGVSGGEIVFGSVASGAWIFG